MKTIKLDKDLAGNNGYGGGLRMPSEDVKSYPEFAFTENEPCDIPDEGELTIKYRLVRHSEDTTNEAHPKYSYTICVKKLISAVGESDKSPSKSYDNASGALDALVAAKNEEKGDEY